MWSIYNLITLGQIRSGTGKTLVEMAKLGGLGRTFSFDGIGGGKGALVVPFNVCNNVSTYFTKKVQLSQIKELHSFIHSGARGE